MVLQCLFTILEMDGSLGSKEITKTGLWESFVFTTFFKASLLGICLALSMAELTNPLLYSLANKRNLSSLNLFSLSSSREQILTILSANENGILSVVWLG